MPGVAKHRRILGENIRHFRARAKWSQERLAERADLHPTYVSDLENGKENVSVDTLARIARVLKVTLRQLIGDA